jgi:hypothetical protein
MDTRATRLPVDLIEAAEAEGRGEQVVANVAIDAAISTAANERSFADRLAARGITTVTMNAQGNVVRRHPDGTTSVV